MASINSKDAIESETCVLCSASGNLLSPEEYDAVDPPLQVPLRVKLLHLNKNKVIPEGRFCPECINHAIEAYDFSIALSKNGEPPLSEKIRALRRKLHELTEKIDVFIVVGKSGVDSSGGYSEDDIIMVEHDAVAAAAAADDEDLEQARNACGETVYQCSVCPLTFQRANEYREHIAQHPGSARHSCWTCAAQFISRAALKDHLVTHAAADISSTTCCLCHAKFLSTADLWHHEAKCKAQCPLCDFRCVSRSALSAHAQAKHSTNPPLLCNVCFRSFHTSELFSAHRLQHRHADRFICGYDACILRFATRNDLLAHIRKSHSGSETNETEIQVQTLPDQNADGERTKNFPCSECERRFVSMASLKAHLRVHRNNRKTQQNDIEWQPEPEEDGEEADNDGEVEYLEVDVLDDMDYEDDDK